MTDFDPRTLLQTCRTYIDVRSPTEFRRGAIPGAINLPILDDAERQAVGLTYRQAGQDAAIAKGHALVAGAKQRRRVEAWLDALQADPDAWLYCWRGGLRSTTAVAWLRERDRHVQRVPGGFKALRRCCLTTLAEPSGKAWHVLGGRTGSGKTEFLSARAEAIDLEGLANHRGSAFGARPGGQPSLVDFENRLAVAFLRHPTAMALVEDESRTIGRLALPPSWFEQMQQAPLLLLEVDIQRRVANICREYVDAELEAGTPPSTLQSRYQAALDRIKRRLGGKRHAEVSGELAQSFANGNHAPWIERLLIWYYDPMYDYQLQQKQQRVIARGDANTIEAALNDLLERLGDLA